MCYTTTVKLRGTLVPKLQLCEPGSWSLGTSTAHHERLNRSAWE